MTLIAAMKMWTPPIGLLMTEGDGHLFKSKSYRMQDADDAGRIHIHPFWN